MKKLLLFVSALTLLFSCSSKKLTTGAHGTDHKTIDRIDEEDGHNKEAILDAPDGTSTHAFKGHGDTTILEIQDKQ
ncbi:MAG: hypothetical protein IJ604_10805 [Prevotella sp.]|nr:hypothetical protein [Prevotella sp.]